MKVERVANNGAGIVKTESGKVAFVPGTLPGEEVTFEVIKEKKSFIEAKLKKINSQSPERIKAKCPYYGKCGGCQLQHTSPEYQLELKKGWFLDALKRVGKWDNESLETASQVIQTRSLSPWNYRQRVRLHVKNGHIGFHAQGSHLIQEVEDCVVAFPGFQDVLKNLRKKLPDLLWEYNIRAHVEIEVTQDSLGNIAAVPVRADYVHGKMQNKRHGKPQSLLHKLVPLFEEEFPEYSLKKLSFEHSHLNSFTVPPESFVQPHREAVNCYSEFIEYTITENSYLFSDKPNCVDLYSGAGALTFSPLNPLQHLSPTLTAVEGVGPSIETLKKTKTPYPVKAIANSVEDFLEHTQTQYDIVLSDPPRSGMGLETMDFFLKSQPKNRMFIYVACDSSAFARDCSLLLKAGYQLSELLVCDAFPQTLHFETVGVFIKP